MSSTVAGLLFPNPSPAPLEGDPLANFFHDWICGITGLDATLAMPRWQPEPPNIPEEGVTWIAFGITKRVADTYAAEVHSGVGLGYNEIRRHENLILDISCYGPGADALLQLLRDGVQVAQNREILSLNSMGLVETGDIMTVPELIKDKWLYRADMEMVVRRQIVRDYQVQSLASAGITLNNEDYITDISI